MTVSVPLGLGGLDNTLLNIQGGHIKFKNAAQKNCVYFGPLIVHTQQLEFIAMNLPVQDLIRQKLDFWQIEDFHFKNEKLQVFYFLKIPQLIQIFFLIKLWWRPQLS